MDKKTGVNTTTYKPNYSTL